MGAFRRFFGYTKLWYTCYTSTGRIGDGTVKVRCGHDSLIWVQAGLLHILQEEHPEITSVKITKGWD